MDLSRWFRRSAVATAILALAIAVAHDVPANAETAAPQPRLATPVEDASFVDSVCDVVRSQGVSSAAKSLISSGGGLGGALLAEVIVTTIEKHCPSIVEAGVRVVRSILATPRPPKRSDISSRRTYLVQLPAQRSNVIGFELGVSGAYVLNARAAVCNAVQSDSNSALTVARWFPNARLVHLPAMNAFIRFVVDTCRGVTAYDANFITGAVLNLVVGNEYRRDLDPPVAQIYRTRQQRYTDGTTVVTAWFRMFDLGGLRSCDMWIAFNGAWHPLAGPCGSHSVRLRQGTPYKWAFRATDRSGHVSQWLVTSFGVA